MTATVAPAVPLGFTEATAAVTAPGQRFETGCVVVDGREYTTFRNAPPSLRAVFDAARQFTDRTALVHASERWTFGDVFTQMDAVGASLVADYGIRPGDRVAIAMRNLPEWIVAFGAITSIGAICVSVNAWGTAEEMAFVLADSGTRVVIADAVRIERTAGARERLGIRAIAVRTPDAGASGVRSWSAVVDSRVAMPPVPVAPDDDATLLYTSGTTGRPKGAVCTHRSIVQALFGFACRTAIDVARRPETAVPPAERRMMLVVPLFHVTGCVPIMLSTFLTGSTLVMLGRWDAGEALRLIEAERVTGLLGVPTQALDLLEHPDLERYDLSSLRSIGGGGAPAAPSLVRRIAEQFPRGGPAMGYGLTETNGHGTANGGADYVERPTSCGRGTPMLSIGIRDAAGVTLPVGSSGEVWMYGIHLFRGYWNSPDATAAALVDGWFRTGDLGRLDEEGFLYLEDRLTDMVLRGGENVYCAEVEAALFEHPAVLDAAVYGLPHARLGEEVAASVVLRPGSTVSAAELQEFVARRLAAFKVPSHLLLHAGDLPRSAVGKVLKRQLRAAAGPPAPA